MIKYAIECVNRGMWGFTSLLKSDGKTLIFDTKEAAQAEVDKINKSNGNINTFTSYYVTEIERES